MSYGAAVQVNTRKSEEVGCGHGLKRVSSYMFMPTACVCSILFPVHFGIPGSSISATHLAPSGCRQHSTSEQAQHNVLLRKIHWYLDAKKLDMARAFLKVHLMAIASHRFRYRCKIPFSMAQEQTEPIPVRIYYKKI